MTAPPFAALLLAGGRSERMGTDKARLIWQGQPLWRLQLAKLAALAPARLIVACREAQGLHTEAPAPACEWGFDPPGSDDGPLAAIARALGDLLQQALAERRLGLQKLLAAGVAQGALEVRPAPAQAGLDNVNTPEEWVRQQKGGPGGPP